ncbi:hypothetical protein RugamoR57_07510 [Duganella caerulea]|uniref:hypothetical protein n=1 Tax=Duganella caerulea TaxID=2885762 RepID=UPI0030EAF486
MPKKYDPNLLFNALLERLRLKNDAALSRALEVGPPLISKVRRAKLPLSSSFLIRIHEVSGLEIGELRKLMGERRAKVRVSEAAGMRRGADRQ